MALQGQFTLLVCSALVLINFTGVYLIFVLVKFAGSVKTFRQMDSKSQPFSQSIRNVSTIRPLITLFVRDGTLAFFL